MGLLDNLKSRVAEPEPDDLPEGVAEKVAIPEPPAAVSAAAPAEMAAAPAEMAAAPAEMAAAPAPAPKEIKPVPGCRRIGVNREGIPIHADAAGQRFLANEDGLIVSVHASAPPTDWVKQEFVNERFLTRAEEEQRAALHAAPQAAEVSTAANVTTVNFKKTGKSPTPVQADVGLMIGPGEAVAQQEAPAAKPESAPAPSAAPVTKNSSLPLRQILGDPMSTKRMVDGQALQYPWGTVTEKAGEVSVLAVREVDRTVAALLKIAEERGWNPVAVGGADQKLRHAFIAAAFEKGIAVSLSSDEDREFLAGLEKEATEAKPRQVEKG